MTTLPNGLFKVTQIRELERLALEIANLTSEQLMERAGAAAFHVLRQQWPQAQTITVFCGTGNNAGDGYIVARLAKEHGLHVNVWQIGEWQHLTGAALTAAQACQTAKVSIQSFTPEVTIDTDVTVDALLGIGAHSTVNALMQLAITTINLSKTDVLAIDVPSGLSADTGKLFNSAVQATATITFLALKQGLFTANGPAYCGALYYDNLGLSQDVLSRLSPSATRLTLAELQHFLMPRPRNTHKGDFGHVLVIGGDYGMAGAVRMAAEAAARAGAGLVTVATRPEHIAIISATRPELLCYSITQPHDLTPLLKQADVVVIGPGLGRKAWGQTLLNAVLTTDLPLVVDADALYWLSQEASTRPHWILTPHPGEAARLLTRTTEAIQADRFTAAQTIQKQYGGITILKGAGTIIAGHLSEPRVCDAGNPGMASAGMGDVLSGIIAGLLAQKIPPEIAAQLAVCLHATAGDRAAVDGERGMLAVDLMPHLRRLVNPRY